MREIEIISDINQLFFVAPGPRPQEFAKIFINIMVRAWPDLTSHPIKLLNQFTKTYPERSMEMILVLQKEIESFANKFPHSPINNILTSILKDLNCVELTEKPKPRMRLI